MPATDADRSSLASSKTLTKMPTKMPTKMSSKARTLVIQSHRAPLPAPWYRRCLDSVCCWAENHRFTYRFIGDELFHAVPEDIRERTVERIVVATDLARLLEIREGLREGYSVVVWCDADFLVTQPDRLILPDEAYALGREVWVQGTHDNLRSYTKVHNAFLMFREDNAFLEFYIDIAMRLIRAHDGSMVPQFIGPKLLTAIHNVVSCPVVETAAMLSPLVAKDLVRGGGPALELFRRQTRVDPAAVNLCGSLLAREELTDEDVCLIIDLLLNQPDVLSDRWVPE